MTDKGNAVVYPQQFVAVAEHYVLFLCKKGYMDTNFCIEKENFKRIFEEDYKQKYPVRAHTSNLLAALNYVRLLKKIEKRNQETMHFHRNRMETLLKKNSDEVLQKHPDANLAKPKLQKLVQQQFAFKAKIEIAPDIKELDCFLCKVQFSSESELKEHEQKLDHKLRKIYRSNRKSLDGKLFNIDTSTVSESVKVSNGECLVRKEEKVRAAAVIANRDNMLCTITDVSELIPSTEIRLGYRVPSVVQPGKTIQFTVEAKFSEIAAVIYPLVFHITKDNKNLLVLHEMVFRVQSEEVDDLGPTAPYKRIIPIILETAEYPTVSGVPPPMSKKKTPCVRPLNSYPIPADLKYIINNGFRETPGMENNVKGKLKKILGMLKESNRGKVIADMKPKTYSEFMRLLLHMEEHQMLLDIHMFDREDQTMTLHSNKKLCILKVPGLAEKRPSVMKNDRIIVKIKGDKECIQYEGIVHAVRELDVYLGFREQFLKKFMPNMKFSISFTVNRYPLQLQHRALTLLESSNMSSLMFPNKYSHSSSANIQSWFNYLIETNEEQKTAVCNIVSGSFFPSPYVVFGPPGTGKTVTIVESILQLWRHWPDAHILACTPSNSAADVLTKRLLKHMPKNSIFRIYADSWTGDSIPEEIKQCSNYEANEDTFYLTVEDVVNKCVVITTLITAGKLVSAGVPEGHFTHVFIDESGQAPEPELLVPVCGLLTSKSHPGQLLGRFILAGDPKQLGPILRSIPASHLGLGTSFLERLVMTNEMYKRNGTNEKYNCAVITKLVKNFRSHEQILKVPNELFYDNELKACGGDITTRACKWSQLPKKGFPIIFHGVKGKDERQADSPSYFNRQEIDVAIKYVAALLEERLSGYKVEEKDIGIITPYRLQVQKFRQVLKKKWSDITVGSVEEFQGQERLIIIISTVRSRTELLNDDYKHHLGFLKNPKRFNVAVTRPKALLIVIGNPDVLQHDKCWRKLIEFCHKNGACAGCKLQLQVDHIPSIDDDFNFNFAGLSLGKPSNVEDGPQWRSEM
ncbi:putative helicase MOV-10 [Schistocerca serialis cubense]|uniref:putative helicase MOV-10 n=1 Tax=Schistocerca serialis cubense TaxID=2023355 RepID=UPI00214EA54C|nr:putative helicase MOV-10 [Schistocerca serialis cubense]